MADKQQQQCVTRNELYWFLFVVSLLLLLVHLSAQSPDNWVLAEIVVMPLLLLLTSTLLGAACIAELFRGAGGKPGSSQPLQPTEAASSDCAKSKNADGGPGG